MIVFGAQKSILGTYELPLTKCVHCHSHKTLLYRVYQKHGHLFWIPMFPLDKATVTVCTHCKQSFTDEQIPQEYWNGIANQNIKHKAPLWNFIGLFLFGILVITLIIGGLYGSFHNKNILSNPQKNDMYFIRNKDWSYSLLKVARATEDTVYINKSVLSVNQSSGMQSLLEFNAFDSLTTPYSKKELRKMYDQGKMINILRGD